MSQEAHAGCLSFELSLRSSTASWSIAACPRRAARPGGRWRARRPRIRPSRSTTPRRAASSTRASLKRLLGGRRSSPARATCRCARRSARTASCLRASHDGYAGRFGVDPPARAAPVAATAAARRRGSVRAAARRSLPAPARRRIRGALPPASGGQGEPADRRPRRHAAAAEQGRVDVRRLRGARANSRRASISPAPRARAAPCRS